MPGLGAFSQPGVTAVTTTPNVTNLRTTAVVQRVTARPLWKAFRAYNPVDRAVPTVPQPVRSSAFQTTAKQLAQWIIPGFEPWTTPRFSGNWGRGASPGLGVPYNARQVGAPRIPFVVAAPGYLTQPATINLRSAPY